MDNAELGLYDLLLDKITQDGDLSERATDLVLAAWDGQATLEDLLEGRPVELRTDSAPERGGHSQTFLAAIRVEGFRGVGKAATLKIRPGPGLTLVTGRNGSGKSSFAEAAELVLTGDCERWKKPAPAEVRQGWRNLHDPASSSITVDVVTDGASGTTHIAWSWQPDEDLDSGRRTRQLPGAKREPFDGAGWRDDMTTYRPFLSYSELGKLLNGTPSQLYDALHKVLGLGPLTEAKTRLTAARKQLAEPQRTVTKGKRELRERLVAIDDDRARRAADLLKPSASDLEALAKLLDSPEDVEEIGVLNQLRTLNGPDPTLVAEAADRIRAAVDHLGEVATADVRSADGISSLLRMALAHHEHAGDGLCPVCHQGRLDLEWRARAHARASELESAVGELRTATLAVESAVREARRLVQTTPVLLLARTPLDTGEAVRAWRTWSDAAAIEQPAALAHALGAAVAPLTQALADLRGLAEAELSRRDEVWAPIARHLAAWLRDAEAAVAASSTLTEVEAAEKWLTAASDELRDDRLAPFAEASERIWEQLRQQSNVSIGRLRLTGGNTRRHAELDVRVDGTEGNTALSVLSQGELHALGLSLFLPRATVEHSPFRFMMIDDPVQAMDPAKVDGLAQVLAEASGTRQVVVFTHDDRLAEAIRRLEIPANILEVQRGEGSIVQIRDSHDPVRRYISDARAIASSPELPTDIRGAVVANNCRGAIEAACHAKIRAARLTRGEKHGEVEQAITDAVTTRDKLSLVLFDDVERRSDVDNRLGSLGRWALRAFQASVKGAHQGLRSDPHGVIDDVEKLAGWIK